MPLTLRRLTLALVALAVSVGPDASGQAGDEAVARNLVLAIVTAAKNYMTEYGKWPSVVERIDGTSNPKKDLVVGDLPLGATFHNSTLFNVLRALSETSNIRHANNPRRIVFLESNSVADPAQPRSGFLNRDGDLAQRGCLFDPWGREYLIALDYDGSGSVIAPNGEIVQSGVIVWSAGPDGESGTADDIRSWQPAPKGDPQPPR